MNIRSAFFEHLYAKLLGMFLQLLVIIAQNMLASLQDVGWETVIISRKINVTNSMESVRLEKSKYVVVKLFKSL
jgi:hypothetical protein